MPACLRDPRGRAQPRAGQASDWRDGKADSREELSAKQVAIDELRAADGPLKAKEIAKRVIDSGRFSGLKGKTPEATISAMLAVGSKPDGPFKRVDKGTYTLADAHAMNGGPTQKRQAKPRTQKGVAKPRPQKQHPTKRTG